MTPEQNKQGDRTSLPWPHWLLRYIATDAEEAFNDLIWSVGGSPPYGGVSYEEAEAVYELLEEYRGPGEASPKAYEKVGKLIAGKPDRLRALELFRIRDRIASSPENFSAQDVERGAELSVQLNHPGARVYFRLLHAELMYQLGEIPEAAQLNSEGLSALEELALADAVYAEQLLKALKNTVSFAAMNGDFTLARTFISQMERFGAGEVLSELRGMLGPSPVFDKGFSKVLDRASNYLESGDSRHALEWYAEAERLARLKNDKDALCELLGDKAVAFRRIGNIRRAIETNREAIELSRKQGNWLTLCRWSGNLGQIYLTQGETKAAELCFKEALSASREAGQADQISLAVANYASLLGSQRRFKEAIDTIDEAIVANPGNAFLADVCRLRKFWMLVEWGKYLSEEGQAAEALAAWTQALKLSDRSKLEEKEATARLHLQIAVLHEREHDIPAASAAMNAALGLFAELGDAESARQCKEVLRNFEKQGYKHIKEREAKNDVEEIRRAIADAVAEGDQQKEATDRVNLATILLSRNDPKAMAAFDEALSLVRRMQDRRRELILYLNFTPYLLSCGERARALEMAKRANTLAKKGTLQQKLLSALNLGQVWQEGHGEPRKAFEYQRQAIHLLKGLSERDPSAAKALREMTKAGLAAAGKNALDLGFVDESADIVALLDPRKGAEIAQLKAQGQQREAEPDIAEIRGTTRPDLAPILAAWRGAEKGGQSPATAGDEQILHSMAELAGILGWKAAQVRLARASTPGKTRDDASRGGPAGLLRLAEMVASGEIRFPTAQATAKRLGVTEDDLDCLAIFAMNDQTLSRSGAAVVLLELGAEIAIVPERAARFFNVLGMFSARDNPEAAIEHYLKADARLADGGHEAQRAHLRNEAAALLAALGRNEETIDLARSAKELAEAADDAKLASMATGNMGLALMQMNRWEEAIAVFEPLAEQQRRARDEEGLAITHHNLSACYTKLGRLDRVEFDDSTTDPDSVFNQAAALGLQNNFEGAIKLFNRGFALVESSGEAYLREPDVRSNYARTLFSAGRIDDAVAQMKRVAELLEKRNEPVALHEAYSWLAATALEEPSSCEHYAERALQLGRQLGDAEALAIDLGHLGQAKTTVGRFGEAVTALEEANRLLDQAELKSALANALVGAGRAEEATGIYEEQLKVAEKGKNLQRQVRLLLGLADARAGRGQETDALALLQKAQSLAVTLGSPEHQSQVANRLGVAYIRANRLEEAARTLEQGVDVARAAGLWRIELSLLANLSNGLKEMGDLQGAESTLLQVYSKSRARGLQKSEVTTLASMGNLAATQQRFDEALARYQEAADVANQAGFREAEAACLDSLGSTYSNLGKPERAVEYHLRAAELHKELDQRADQITDLSNLAQAYLMLNEVERAAATMRQAQEMAQHYGIIQWQVPFIMGQVAARQGDWTRARPELHDAILRLESVRSSLKTPAQQRQWVADKAQAYQVAAEAAIIAGDGGAAIEFSESNRARFLQAILHRRSTRPAGVDEQTWLRYERAGDRLAHLRGRRRAGLALRDARLDQEVRSAETEYAKASAALQGTGHIAAEGQSIHIAGWEDLAREIPLGYVAVSIEAFPTGIGAIVAGRDRASKPWAQAGLIETFTKSDLARLVFGDRILIQQALSSRTPLDDVPLDAVGWALGINLLGKDDSLRAEHSRRYGLIVRDPFRLATQTITHVSNILGARVWAELIKYLPPKVKNVILIPAAGFNLLPLHAASLADGSRIDKHFNVSYSPSLTLLKRVRGQPPLPKKALLGQVVNPTGDLVFSSLEAKAVARCKGYSGLRSITRADASVDSVMAMLKEVDIFHYSGHAYFDDQESFRSGLILGSADHGGSVLTLGTILDSLSIIRSKFIILSACETGQVELEDKLNDFLGLPGGFIVAGAKAVLATLWRVDDLASCLLLEKFFEVWRDNPNAATEALARAQQWIRTDVTVEYVQEKIESWRKETTDRKEEKVLLEQSRYWRARKDSNTLPFKDEIYWAAFYLTGFLDGDGRNSGKD